MIVVSDTSILFYLSKIGCIELLPQLFEEVIIPEAVFNELNAVDNYSFIQNLLAMPWLKKLPVRNRQNVKHFQQYVDKGEAEAIALAAEISPKYILIDEKLGRAVAAKMNLEILGTLGLLLIAKRNNILPAIKPIIDKLMSETNFRCNPKLVTDILEKANEK
jgi:predicted nucleic acid-binding protein